VTFAVIEVTELSLPVHITLTSVLVAKEGMWHTAIALLISWAIAGRTLAVTRSDIDITVLSAPVDVADTVMVVENSVFDTDVTVHVGWAVTPEAAWIAGADVGCTVVA
jgi:hypothetical protein